MSKEEADKFIKKNLLGPNLRVETGIYQIRALFPFSVSSVHPSTMILLILEQFVKPSDKSIDKDPATYLQEQLKEYSFDTSVKNDKNKQKLIKEWIKQDLCVSTKDSSLFLEPISLHVPANLPWKKKQEPYARTVKDLLRTGRNNLEGNFEKPLTVIRDVYKITHKDPLSSVVSSCLDSPEESKWKADPKTYPDFTFCSSQGRVFQDDIMHLMNWDLTSAILSKWIPQIITFHLCTHYLKMALLVDDLVYKAKSYISSPGGGVEKLSCEQCPDHSGNPPAFQKSCADCPYNPGYFLNEEEKTQDWYEALNRYQENVSSLKMIAAHMNNGEKVIEKNDLSDFLKKINRFYGINTEDVKSILKALSDFQIKSPPKNQSWEFFGRYACNEKESKFMSQVRNGKLGMKLTDRILLIFSHCFISIQKQNSKPPLFTDFLEYLCSRGFKTRGINTTFIESRLRSLGLMDTYSDMGAARELKAVLKEKK
jgi:hypothetical protein